MWQDVKCGGSATFLQKPFLTKPVLTGQVRLSLVDQVSLQFLQNWFLQKRHTTKKNQKIKKPLQVFFDCVILILKYNILNYFSNTHNSRHSSSKIIHQADFDIIWFYCRATNQAQISQIHRLLDGVKLLPHFICLLCWNNADQCSRLLRFQLIYVYLIQQ